MAPRPQTPTVHMAAVPLALAVAAGTLAGSVVAPAPRGLGTTLVPPSPAPVDLGVRWSSRVVTPTEILQMAMDGLGLTVACLAAMTALVALAAAATLLVAVGSRRRRELTVRGALGTGRAGLIRLLLQRDASALVRGVLVGGLMGGAGAAALHAAWPVREALRPSFPTNAVAIAATLAATASLSITVILTVLPARYGVRDLSRRLAAGSRATPDRWEGGLRRIATVFQIAVSLALLSASALLWRALPERELETGRAHAVVLLRGATEAAVRSPAERARRYRDLLDGLGALPFLTSANIASPGAWTGVATADLVVALCGPCPPSGPFPTPMVRHHAVSPGFFEAADMELLSGRDFTLEDVRSSEPVAIVTESMSRENFMGRPLGKEVRIGRGLESWYTVVGVVRENRAPGLGLPDPPVQGVYLSALQHPPDRVEVAFRPVPDGGEWERTATIEAVRAVAIEVGLTLAPMPRTAGALRQRRAEPLVWAASTAHLLGWVALLSAVLGVHRVATVEVRARRRELGTRLALGSTAARLERLVLGRAFRSALLGAALAVLPTLLVAGVVRETMGDVPLFDPPLFSGVATLLVAVALVGARGPARRAARLEPATAMSEE